MVPQVQTVFKYSEANRILRTSHWKIPGCGGGVEDTLAIPIAT